MSKPKSAVLTRERLEEIRSDANGTYRSPSDYEYDAKDLLAFIEDHLLPVVRAAANARTMADAANAQKECCRVLSEGGY